MDLNEKLRSRQSNRQRVLQSMTAASSAPWDQSLVEAIEQRQRAQQPRTHAGPRPPAAWVSANRRVNKRGSCMEMSLMGCAALAVAKQLGGISQHGTHASDTLDAIGQLSFHLKQIILCARAALTQQGVMPRLHPSMIVRFMDPQLRTLCLAHSAVDLDTLKLFLPPSSKSIKKNVPDSWDNADDSSSDADSDTSDPSHLHALDISFTMLDPYKLIKALSLAPNLSRLCIAGCFDSVSGPSFLSRIPHVLINLAELDVSHNVWVNEDAVYGMALDRRTGSFGLLRVFDAVDIGWPAPQISAYFLKIRPEVEVNV
ncbi:hypothetical protein BJ741DRAFT_597325 [Chytriomyces cf. hyalinus JEL632]|nr:hypothetical protein BJ741DRAFT_597325 [Chytriomyces cf. hyalinus JEL632]